MDARPAPVASFSRAQCLVPFPVVQPPGQMLELSVRPEDRDRWPTVWSVHRFRDVLVRVKQFVYLWYENLSLPANLVREGGHEYGPTTTFPVQGQVGSRGMDYEGRESGSVVLFSVHDEVRVLEGRLGVDGMWAFMEEFKPADAEIARAIAAKPLPLWSWAMRGGRAPWNDAPTPVAWMKWFMSVDAGMAAWGGRIPIPEVPGHQFDSIGVLRDPAHAHEECFLLYRSQDLHRALEARFVRLGSRLQWPTATDWWAGPRYRRSACDVEGFSGLIAYSPPYGEALLTLEVPGGRLAVLMPQALDYDLGHHQRITSSFVSAFGPRERKG